MSNRVFIVPSLSSDQFVYVDCGARGDIGNPLLTIFSNPKYVGFDPGLSQPMHKDKASVYFPVAVGKGNETNDFYITQNPNCSSFFLPNNQFLERFMEVGDYFRIQRTRTLEVVALDEYLPENGIADIDFMELDTQGSELDILKGARKFLSAGILGVRVEVEFSLLYHDQPLFAEVDSYLRQAGLMLFDLERYHLRRKTAPAHSFGREQIVWGQALYFKNYNNLILDGKKSKLIKLATLASYYGFHSYALEVLEFLLGMGGMISETEKEEILRAREEYQRSFRQGWPIQTLFALGQIGMFNWTFHKFRNLVEKLTSLFGLIVSEKQYFWKD